MHAPLAHRHAGQVLAGGPRLVGEAVVDDAVDALREDAVALRLEAVGRLLPAADTLCRIASKSLHRHNAPPPDVREGSGEARVADGRDANARLAPELAHRDVGGGAVLEVVRRAAAVGLQRELQPARMALLRERARVVLGEEVGDGAAEVGEKALRLVRRADDVPGEDGVVGGHRVAAPPREFALEALRPVLRADLVAVDEDAVEAVRDVARERAEEVAELRDVGVEVEVERARRELVDLQPNAAFGRRMVASPVRRVAEADDRPIAGRNIPRQRPILRQPVREVNDGRFRDDLLRLGLRAFDRDGGADAKGLRRKVTNSHSPLDGEVVQPHVERLREVGHKTERPRRDGLCEREEAPPRVRLAGCAQHDLARDERTKRRSVVRDLDTEPSRPLPETWMDKPTREAADRDRCRERNQDFLSVARHPRPGVRHVPRVGGRHGVGEDGDVVVEAVRVRWRGKPPRESPGALHLGLGQRQELHAVLRQIPRPARIGPAAAVRQAQLKAEPPSLFRRVADRVEPGGRVECDRAGRDVAARVEDLRAAEADLRHRLQIGGDALLRDVAVHPVPPRLRLGVVRRIAKARLQRVYARKNVFADLDGECTPIDEKRKRTVRDDLDRIRRRNHRAGHATESVVLNAHASLDSAGKVAA